MGFISVEDVKSLSKGKIDKLYKRHYSCGLYRLFKYTGVDINFIRADGMNVYDDHGNRYLDFMGGYGSLNLGHNDERLYRVLEDCSTQPNLFHISENPYTAALAANISYLTGGELSICHFTNSGTETVEEAIKLALMYKKEGNIVYFSNAYHGKTIGALSALGDKVKDNYDPLMYNFIEVPFGDIDALNEVISSRFIAAILAEPVQGEGGIIIPKPDFFRNVRRICDKEDIILILDEIQTGLGRCGSMFCYEQMGFVPDIMCLSKSLSGGVMPIGCMCVEDTLWDDTYGKMKNATLLETTFGGNTLACAVAIKTLNITMEENLPQRARTLGLYTLEKLKKLKEKHRIIKDIRGMGLLIGIEFSRMNELIPDSAMGFLVSTIVSKMMNEHKIICGYTSNNLGVLRVEPPLIVNKEQIDYFINSLDSVLEEEDTLIKIGISGVKNAARNLYN